MRISLLVAALGLGACVSGYGGATGGGGASPDGGGDVANDPTCQIASDQQHSPGWPFVLGSFRDKVLPTLTATCAQSGCHASPGQKGFVLYADAQPGNCSYARDFNAWTLRTDLATPTNSKVYFNITGGNPNHPKTFAKTDPIPTAFLEVIQEAAANQASGAGASNTPPPVAANPFDFAVFQQAIQPILDSSGGRGCSAAICHGAPSGQGGFKLNPNPAVGSAEMTANFNAITPICDLTTPDQSLFYLQATNLHGSGASVVVSQTEAATLLSWITQAKANATPVTGGGGGANCPSSSNFNLGVFEREIQPILFGTVDLNDRTGTRVTTGCARGACHGVDRTGGALVLKETATAAQNLENFACFVNLANPVSSAVLACPLNTAGCPKSPHPGQNVFSSGNTDLNYQRILSYLYGAKTVATPLDFAYFARRVNTIFNDLQAVQGGAQNRTCADAISCHGVTQPGAIPPNGSIFSVLTSASGKQDLLFNFGQAANFTNFVKPEGSSLFLFPTDEIANLANPYATGLHHPGGADFDVDSDESRSILTWARGLRPDGQGVNLNWLVAGTYPAAQITDPTLIDELNVTPSIFDNDGAPQFNGGQWDGLFSDRQRVDLNATFPQAANSGRVAYAVVYVLNTTPSDLQAQVTIVSPNAVKLYAGKQPVLQSNDASAGATGLAVFPSYASAQGATRLLVKVLQRAQDQRFEITVQFSDQFGTPLTDLSGELVFKLSPDGGI